MQVIDIVRFNLKCSGLKHKIASNYLNELNLGRIRKRGHLILN